jgi:hypothetical protein
MTDWPALSRARGIDLPENEMRAIAAVLEALERAFAPLVRELPLETEPATVFRPAPESGEEA